MDSSLKSCRLSHEGRLCGRWCVWQRMNETGRSKGCSQGHPSWEPQSIARSGQDPEFRTGPSTTVLGSSDARSPSFSFQGVSTAVLSPSCAHASREELFLWQPRKGWRRGKGKKGDGLAERPKRPFGWWGEALGYLYPEAHTLRSPAPAPTD